jgi:glycosyltransferase involved in cell wall biosynthesis
MRIALIHQNQPGQFKHLARALGEDPRHEVVFISRRADRQVPGVRTVAYQPHREPSGTTHHYLRSAEAAVLHGQGVARAFEGLHREGFRPDVVVGHPAWGELLFVKDLFPAVPLASYCEFHMPDAGVPIEGQPWPTPLDVRLLRRVESAPLLASVLAADVGWSPTAWQRATFPADLRHKIEVIFDGVDLDEVRPDAGAVFQLPSGRRLTAADEVITYSARGLEPHRGFPQFMRALPEILRRRPEAQVVIAGADQCFYGPRPKDAPSWRTKMLAEVQVDRARVHFVDWLDRRTYLSLLQVSSAHVYLTAPFALSWSFFEAMAAGCLVVGAETPSVLEVLRPGENGLAAPLAQAEAIADTVVRGLSDPDGSRLRAEARRTMEAGYGAQACVRRQLQLIARIAA